MEKINVSIILLSYNPEVEKLISTIKSAIIQKNTYFEIIIADDGSKDDFREEIIDFFCNNNFDNYKLVFSDVNNGTVKNALNGIEVASGEYIYLGSQGDYIFDEFAMADFYSFAKQNNTKICFGDYVSYSMADGLKLYTDMLFPPITSVYEKSMKYYKTSFFLGGNILGPSFFLERRFAIESFKYISKYSRFTQDNTAAAYALANNIEIKYFPRKIVWYEIDTGISSGGEIWRKRIINDMNNTYSALLKEHKRDRIIDAGVMLTSHDMDEENIKTIMCRIFLKHPIICLRKKIINRMAKRIINVSDNEKFFLRQLIEKNY